MTAPSIKCILSKAFGYECFLNFSVSTARSCIRKAILSRKGFTETDLLITSDLDTTLAYINHQKVQKYVFRGALTTFLWRTNAL